jgi:hypothetical protein
MLRRKILNHGGRKMKKKDELFSPIIVGAEKAENKPRLFYSAIIVNGGPCLMKDDKEYTHFFESLIEKHPEILNVTFYNRKKTHYKIKIEGQNKDYVFDSIKKYITEELEKEKDNDE